MLRNFGRLLLVCTGVLLGVQMMGCGGGSYTCQSSSTTCGSFQACCNEKDCYYTYNGKKYSCDGQNCDAAAQQVVKAMCGAAPDALTASDKAALQSLKETTTGLAARARGTRCAVCP